VVTEMLSAVIYKRDASGNIRTWQGEASAGRWRSHAGVMGGALVTSEWADAPARSQLDNERQAIFEMQAQLTKLLAKDYRVSVALVDVPRGSYIKPMLAQKYSSFPGTCDIQPKLDGMRCLANVDGLWSRGAKPIAAAPHVFDALASFREQFPEIILDGELYNHFYHDDFNKLMSVARKLTPTKEELQESRRVLRYYVYDCFNLNKPELSFVERSKFICKHLDQTGPEIELVYCTQCNSEEMVEKMHVKYILEGYEGSMIRVNGPYEQKRSKTLLKNKDFLTDEFVLLAIEEGKGNWSGYAKRAVCKTPEGVEFGAGIKGDQSYCSELLSRGAQAFESVTVRHFGKTADGSIRFPIAISFNERAGIERRPALDADDTSEQF